MSYVQTLPVHTLQNLNEPNSHIHTLLKTGNSHLLQQELLSWFSLLIRLKHSPHTYQHGTSQYDPNIKSVSMSSINRLISLFITDSNRVRCPLLAAAVHVKLMVKL